MKFLISILVCLAAFNVRATSLLSVNGHYFVDSSGRAVYLTGSHTWRNVQDFSGLPTLNFTTHLDFLQGLNHNFTRLWQFDEPAYGWPTPAWGAISPLPWARTGPGIAADGGLKFDLATFDQNYFDRLRDRVAAAEERGIYISVMLHNGWWVHGAPSEWATNQFNPANNINGFSMNLSSVYTLNVPVWLGYMTNYARKVVDTVNGFNNVLYEIGNEMPEQSRTYQNYLVAVIKGYEATKPKQHPVGISSYDYKAVVDHSLSTVNDWITSSGVDWISPGGALSDAYMNAPPVVTGNQPQFLDTDHIWGVGGTVGWVWKSFTRGYNPIYMDPYGASAAPMSGADPGVRAAMGHTKQYADRLHLASSVPSLSVASTGYCLTNSLLQYLVYSPNRSSFSVALPSGNYLLEWFNPQNGAVVLSSGFNNSSSGRVNFTPPSGIATDSVLYLAALAPGIVTPAVITSPPASVSVTAGTSVSFSVGAISSSLNYQWRLNGSPIPGATASTYILASARAADAGNYDVIVSNSAGSVTSAPASLTLITPLPPGSLYRAINVGGPAMILDGETWEADQAPNNGFTANGNVLTFRTPTPFTFNPAVDVPHADMLRSIRGGADLQLTLGNVPSGPYDVYVWTFEDNFALTGALTIEGQVVVPNHASGSPGRWNRLGPFQVDVTDSNIQVRFQCTVNDLVIISGLEVRYRGDTPPAITSQPASVSVAAGTSASFSVSASGTAPNYQWRLNGSPIAGATASSYTLASAQAGDAGSYDVIVSNSAGSVTSAAAVLAVFMPPASSTSLLRVNGHYFVDSAGRAIYLTGSHTWMNQQDFSGLATLDFAAHLNFLQGLNHNFIRLWQWDEPSFNLPWLAWGDVSPMPWARTGPDNAADGGLKFDLATFDQSYFDRLRDRVAAADARGLYVSVMLHNGWWVDATPGDWFKNQFNPANNINAYAMDLSAVYTMNNPAWVDFMTSYARKVVDTVNGFKNVLYEIGNRMPEQSLAYQNYLISVIKSYEATKPKQHPVGMTSFGSSNFTAGPANSWTTANGWLTSSSADWIAPGGPDYENFQPVVTGSQVQFLDTGHVFNLGTSFSWIWKSFMRGYCSLYMDPYGVPGFAVDVSVRAAMGHTKRYADYIDLASTVPSLSVASTGYCLTNNLPQYLVYSPNANPFTVALPSGYYVLEWFNPQNGTLVQRQSFNNSLSGDVSFAPPFEITTDGVLYIALQASAGGNDQTLPTSVNHPPVAGNDSVERPANQPVTIPVSQIIANDSDPNNHTLTLASVSSPTANGATVIIDAGSLIYTPPSGFSGTDTFNYTVSDGYGGSARGLVTITVRD